MGEASLAEHGSYPITQVAGSADGRHVVSKGEQALWQRQYLKCCEELNQVGGMLALVPLLRRRSAHALLDQDLP